MLLRDNTVSTLRNHYIGKYSSFNDKDRVLFVTPNHNLMVLFHEGGANQECPCFIVTCLTGETMQFRVYTAFVNVFNTSSSQPIYLL
jgi:hypothetical protein